MGISYLGSRRGTPYIWTTQWERKRQAVFKRCRGICERCNRFAAQHAHHLTYERLFHESLTDLLGVCLPCHSFVHGRGTYDPLMPSIYVEVLPQTIDYWDMTARGLRRVDVSTLPHECQIGMLLDGFRPGRFMVPASVFYKSGLPRLNAGRWAKFRVATRFGDTWESEPTGRALFGPSRLIVEPAGESHITRIQVTAAKGVVLDIERRNADQSYTRSRVEHAEHWLADGTIYYDRAGNCWRASAAGQC